MKLKKQKFWNKLTFFVGGLVPTTLLIAACGQQGKPVDALIETTFYYKTKDGQQQTVEMRANWGNPTNIKPSQIKEAGNWYGEDDLKDKPLLLQKRAFFASLASNYFVLQMNAIVSESALLRTYYSTLTQKNDKTISISAEAKKSFATYFGSEEANKKLFQNPQTEQADSYLSKRDVQFAFAMANSLTNGDGFSGYSRSYNFKPSSAQIHLGNLEGVNWTDLKVDPSSKNIVTKTLEVIQKKDGEDFKSNVENKYIKFKIEDAYLNFGFFESNKTPLTNSATDLAKINDYFKATPANSVLFPTAFQQFDNLEYTVKSNKITLLQQLTKAQDSNDLLLRTLLNQKSDSGFEQNVTWNTFGTDDKLFKSDIKTFVSGISNVNKANINNRVINRTTLDHIFESQKQISPNIKKIEEIAKIVPDKPFSEVTGTNKDKYIDWKQFTNLQVNDLLFSLFDGFDYNPQTNTVENKATNKKLNFILKTDLNAQKTSKTEPKAQA